MKYLFLFSILFLISCKTSQLTNLDNKTSVEAKVVQMGLLDAYPSGLKMDSVNFVYAEASAALKMGDTMLIAIDKLTPKGTSPVFTVPVADFDQATITNNQVKYVTTAPFQQVVKIEAMTKSVNDSVFFATTAFDRIRGNAADWDGYNALLTWQKPDFSDLAYVAGTERDGVTSSRDIRASIQKVLTTSQFPNGAPYFKIEALVALPGNRLIFGVREIGESYQKFDYSFTLLETTFKLVKGAVQIDPNFKKVYQFQPVVNGRKMGIADLVYHAASNSLIALTSYEELGDEKTKQLTSSLWVLPVDKMQRGEAPIPLWNKGKQIEFLHKGEALALLDDRSLLVIFDEDRKDSQVMLSRKTVQKQPHQVIYVVVKIK
jgi:hypothetical protein